jgi:hypothetical protein
MDLSNILSEGVIEDLLQIFLPKHVQDNIKGQNKEKIKKLENDLDKANKEFDDATEKVRKALENQFGKKIKKQSSKKVIDNYYKSGR